jgi:hypothetical protein
MCVLDELAVFEELHSPDEQKECLELALLYSSGVQPLLNKPLHLNTLQAAESSLKFALMSSPGGALAYVQKAEKVFTDLLSCNL